MTPYYIPTSLTKEEKYTKDNNIYVFGKDFIQSFKTDGGGHTIKIQKFTKLILHSQMKDLYYHYTAMVMIFIYLLM